MSKANEEKKRSMQLFFTSMHSKSRWFFFVYLRVYGGKIVWPFIRLMGLFIVEFLQCLKCPHGWSVKRFTRDILKYVWFTVWCWIGAMKSNAKVEMSFKINVSTWTKHLRLFSGQRHLLYLSFQGVLRTGLCTIQVKQFFFPLSSFFQNQKLKVSFWFCGK